jgi:hypothetical protein
MAEDATTYVTLALSDFSTALRTTHKGFADEKVSFVAVPCVGKVRGDNAR